MANSSSCPRCGASLPAEAKFCAACGYATTRLTPGRTLDGKYEILEKIGEGGMGEVYKARHLHLDEIRIIKVTKPDPLGEGPEPRRFQEEARIATLVRHPHVAALYDFSRLADGSYYMVWEYIDGITLEQWLRRYGPLPADRALDVAQQVLEGLAQIHAQGIVHRDLSPDNIMLQETKDGRLVAKIIDLGIAKRVAAETLQKMTGTGMFVGKLKYCSPEQAGALASGQTIDGRSDLYSLGVVLYEMLSGKAPFESQTPEGYLGKHLHERPPPLDTARLPGSIGPALAMIVERALEKNRDRRFSGAEEFAAALARLRAAATEPLDHPTTAILPRHRPAAYAWALGTLLAIAAAAAIYVVNRAGRPAAAPSVSATPTVTSAARRSPTPPIDEVVVAPRILEDTPAATATRPAGAQVPTRVATAIATRTPAPASTTAPVPTATPQPFLLPNGQPLTEKILRRRIDEWSTLPIERRAHGAVRIAYLTRYWIRTHPEDPFTAELKQTLPRSLKEEANRAESNRRPGLAMEFLVAYLQLSPDDSQALSRLNTLRDRVNRQRRPAKD